MKINTWTTEDYNTRNILYPAKDTLHQIDLYLILTLGSGNGFGYYVELWHKVKRDRNNSPCNNNNDNNNNNNNNDDDDNNFIILKIMIMMVIMMMMIILNNTE